MKNIKNSLSALANGLLLISLIFMLGCKDQKVNEVFNQPATERLQDFSNSLRQKLQSSAFGWTVSYQPSVGETGYYQFLFHFLNDTEVESASDFSKDDLTLQKSEYSILTGSTSKLSFSTYSPIHKLSDSNFSPIPRSEGAGLKGDFEFLFYGENDQGDLIFRTNRTNKTLLFKKATENSLNELKMSFDNFEKLTQVSSFCLLISELKDGHEARSSLKFPYNARAIEIQLVHKEPGGEKVTFSPNLKYTTGYGLTPEGIFLDSLQLSSGEEVKNLVLKYTEGRFLALLKEGTQVTLGYRPSPVIPVDDQKIFLDASRTDRVEFFYEDKDIGYLTTPDFNSLFKSVSPLFFPPTSFSLVVNSNTLNLCSTRNLDDIIERLTYEDKGDRLVMKRQDDSIDNTVSAGNMDNYNKFIDCLTDPQGFYVENLGKITKYTEQIFTFTSAKHPNMQFSVYHIAHYH